MELLDRQALRELTIERYFGAVDGKDLASALECFNNQALLAIGTAQERFQGRAEVSALPKI